MKIELIPSTSDLLHRELDNFDYEKHDAKEIASTLFNCLVEYKGLGLAANQIGMDHRVFIMRGNPCNVCFNPSITHKGEETILLEEGCLTYPNLFVKIRRSKTIRAKWTNELGEVKTGKFDGMTARVFQHELDHLNGISHIDLATGYHKEQAMKKLKKINRMKRRV